MFDIERNIHMNVSDGFLFIAYVGRLFTIKSGHKIQVHFISQYVSLNHDSDGTLQITYRGPIDAFGDEDFLNTGKDFLIEIGCDVTAVNKIVLANITEGEGSIAEDFAEIEDMALICYGAELAEWLRKIVKAWLLSLPSNRELD